MSEAGSTGVDVAATPSELESLEDIKLPFAFARRFGVVLVQDQSRQVLEVCAKSQPSLSTLAEIRRHVRRKTKVRLVASEEFDELLGAAYATDSGEAKQMVEDLGEEMDLASLASALPETEDLLEQQDDAPIIRLINALLAQAIRENASDVHIETFEQALVVRFRVDGVMREVVLGVARRQRGGREVERGLGGSSESEHDATAPVRIR